MRLETKLDPETLREKPSNPEKLRQAIDHERAEIQTLRDVLDSLPAADISAQRGQNTQSEQKDSDDLDSERLLLNLTRLARHLNRLRDYLALADSRVAALASGSEALGIWEALHRKKATFLAQLEVAKLRFDVVDADAGLQLLTQLVNRSKQEPLDVYRGFALEARALCRWRAGDIQQAIDDADAALQLRRNRQVSRLITRTETIRERIQRDS